MRVVQKPLMGACDMLSLTHELITGLGQLEGHIRQSFRQPHLMKALFSNSLSFWTLTFREDHVSGKQSFDFS